MLSHDDTKTVIHASQISLITFCSLLVISLPISLFSLLLTSIALRFELITSEVINSTLSLTLFCFVALIIGLISIYYALRIQFNKQLFKYLAIRNEQIANTLIELDNVLVTFHFIKSNPISW
ncbi:MULTISPECIES: hypothetical protein [unclassified Gilliamella]|uniref:hypothetical protein n=1 Tax=unclassified Gilliamella TaxID=2685620 RepID=UPI00080ECFDB|nr:hypothetical protein [Gilliamella apicola]OCG19321.1 hypothetical protein A9G23_09285 [Gilliamella apicola]OCG22404.1 hypothetical protein A9G22_07490 [Gilliamella apicola]